MRDSVAEAVVLAVVDEIVVDVMPVAGAEKNAAVGKGGYLAIVDFQPGMCRDDAVGRGKLVVVRMPSAPLAERPAVMVEIPLSIRTANPQPRHPNVRPGRTNYRRCLQRIAGQNGPLRPALPPFSGQGHPFGNHKHQLLNIDPRGQIDLRLSRDEDDLAGLGLGQGV